MKSLRMLGQAGFTLIEILVALILISLLVAAVFPVVTQQAGQADAPRLANDLTNIRSGIELFNANVRTAFPASLNQLTTDITGKTAIDGTAFTTAEVNRWDGPYIDATGGDIVSGFDATIDESLAIFDLSLNEFVATPASAANDDFVALQITGLEDAEFDRLNTLIDGDSELTASAAVAGKLRKSTASPTIATYLAVPFRR